MLRSELLSESVAAGFVGLAWEVTLLFQLHMENIALVLLEPCDCF